MNFCMVMEIFHTQGIFPQSSIFPQSKNFSTVVEIFRNQITFPQSKQFSTVMEIFHNQETFPKSNNLFQTQRNFPQKFLQTRKFSTNFFFLDQGSFQQTKIFTQSKIFFQTILNNTRF